MRHRDVRPPARRSFIAADRDHDTRQLDAVAGCEFVDDRVRCWVTPSSFTPVIDVPEDAAGTYSKVGPAVVIPSSVGISISAWAWALRRYIEPIAVLSVCGLPLNAWSSNRKIAQ